MKYYAQITRDIVRHISMGPLVVAGMRGGPEQVVAPPRVVEMPLKAGVVTVHKTKADRNAFVKAVNAEHPGAAEDYYLAPARAY